MSIRSEIFNYFRSMNFVGKMYDLDGLGSILDPDEAEYMYFDQDGTSYMVVFDETGTYKHMYVYKSVNDNDFRDILVTIRKIANDWAYSVTVKNFSRKIKPKEFSYLPKTRKVEESFKIKSFKKTSHFMKENARVIVKHREHIDETKMYPNSRKIADVLVETKTGEKRKIPHGNLTLGKAIANYINYGGTLYDHAVDYMISIGQDIGDIGGLEFTESCDMAKKKEILIHLKEAKRQINRYIGSLSIKKKIPEFPNIDITESAFSESFYESYMSEGSAKKAARISILASKLKK